MPLSRGDRFFGDPDAHQKLHKRLYEDHDDHMRKLCAFSALRAATRTMRLDLSEPLSRKILAFSSQAL